MPSIGSEEQQTEFFETLRNYAEKKTTPKELAEAVALRWRFSRL